MLYPMTLAVFAWTTGIDPQFHTEPTLEYYSQTYIAIFLFLAVTLICLQTDLSFFMKVSSAGVIFIIMLIGFIVKTGIVASTNTDFVTGTSEEAKQDNFETDIRTLTLVNSNIGPITGVLCAGYFLHVIGVPILRNAKEPQNNDRDLFLGYFFVFISYLTLGVLGYIGFAGVDFTAYYQENMATSIG